MSSHRLGGEPPLEQHTEQSLSAARARSRARVTSCGSSAFWALGGFQGFRGDFVGSGTGCGPAPCARSSQAFRRGRGVSGWPSGASGTSRNGGGGWLVGYPAGIFCGV